jgi:hypothetical protein
LYFGSINTSQKLRIINHKQKKEIAKHATAKSVKNGSLGFSKIHFTQSTLHSPAKNQQQNINLFNISLYLMFFKSSNLLK